MGLAAAIVSLALHALGGADFGPSGACCLFDGTCEIKSAADCDVANGEYQGDGTTCGTSCAQPTGACCFSGGGCDVRSSSSCSELGGVYQGDNATCGSCVGQGLPPPANGIIGYYGSVMGSLPANLKVVCTYYQPIKFVWHGTSGCNCVTSGWWTPEADGAALTGDAAASVVQSFHGGFNPEARQFKVIPSSQGGVNVKGPWRLDANASYTSLFGNGAYGTMSCNIGFCGPTGAWRLWVPDSNVGENYDSISTNQVRWFRAWDVSLDSVTNLFSCTPNCSQPGVFGGIKLTNDPKSFLVDSRDEGSNSVTFYSHFSQYMYLEYSNWDPSRPSDFGENHSGILQRRPLQSGAATRLFSFVIVEDTGGGAGGISDPGILSALTDYETFSWMDIDNPVHKNEVGVRADLIGIKGKIYNPSGDSPLSAMEIPKPVFAGSLPTYDPRNGTAVPAGPTGTGGSSMPVWHFRIDWGPLFRLGGGFSQVVEPFEFTVDFTFFHPFRFVLNAFVVGFVFLAQVSRVWSEFRKT